MAYIKLHYIFILIFFFLYISEGKDVTVVEGENGTIHDKDSSTKQDEDSSIKQDEDSSTKQDEDNYFDVDLDNLSLLPNPMELYEYINSEDSKIRVKPFSNLKGGLKKRNLTKETFLELYKSALSHFDIDGYTFLMERVMNKEYGNKFLQKKKKKNELYPHCDNISHSRIKNNEIRNNRKERIGNKNINNNDIVEQIDYPGGPIRSSYGNNLSKLMKESLENVETLESSKEPGLANMLLQSLTMVKGLIQSVASSVVDIVPPLIPPPIWINRPLPCLPMVTGKNCLGSILYPITAAEFITADVTDSTMNGIIASFPSKYSSKIGKTSNTQYRICAMAYLGMYCASLFPICWLPIGLKVAETMSVCFPQCLATLIACPGFWIDDIEGPCSDASVPPFCSFSIFVNHKLIPPQLSSYEGSHLYPKTCPERDDNYDIPEELYEHDETERNKESIYLNEKKSYSNISLPTYTDSVKTIYDDNIKPEHIDACNCLDISHLCTKHFAIPVIKKYDDPNYTSIYEHKYEEPVKLTKFQKNCCSICKQIYNIIAPKKKKIIDLRGFDVYPKKLGSSFLSNIVLH
ncbi:hypothetical protein YYE_03697 [Plasmodium vinckei vinckei]|uniref:Uncharacterized protein n=1 Tax=Plasmodium vinckei vinckei TaxID=54757 RepID=A0A081ID41_PLAVN|nr:hypothetical protein YYE_03697 [Plasmodium vinckei vinckei]